MPSIVLKSMRCSPKTTHSTKHSCLNDLLKSKQAPTVNGRIPDARPLWLLKETRTGGVGAFCTGEWKLSRASNTLDETTHQTPALQPSLAPSVPTLPEFWEGVYRAFKAHSPIASWREVGLGNELQISRQSDPFVGEMGFGGETLATARCGRQNVRSTRSRRTSGSNGLGRQ